MFPQGLALDTGNDRVLVVDAALDALIDVELATGGRTIEFSFNSEADRVVVTVRSEDTEEVVRQIPPADYLKFVARFKVNGRAHRLHEISRFRRVDGRWYYLGNV